MRPVHASRCNARRSRRRSTKPRLLMGTQRLTFRSTRESPAGLPVRASLPTSLSASTAITCRFIGRARCTREKGSTSNRPRSVSPPCPRAHRRPPDQPHRRVPAVEVIHQLAVRSQPRRIGAAIVIVAITCTYVAKTYGASPANTPNNLSAIYGNWNLQVASTFAPWSITPNFVYDGRCRWRYRVLEESRESGRGGSTVLNVDLQLNRPTRGSTRATLRPVCKAGTEQYLELSFTEIGDSAARFDFGTLTACGSRKTFDLFKNSPELAACSLVAMQRAR